MNNRHHKLGLAFLSEATSKIQNLRIQPKLRVRKSLEFQTRDIEDTKRLE
jgi:hypothetical protein